MPKIVTQRKHTKEPFWQIFDKIINEHGWDTLRTKRSRVSKKWTPNLTHSLK